VIGNDVYRKGGTVQIVAPDAESFKDGEEFLVVNIVVELRGIEGAGVEGDWVDFSVL